MEYYLAEITNKETGVKLKGSLQESAFGEFTFTFRFDGSSTYNVLKKREWDVRRIPEPFDFPEKPRAIIKATHFYEQYGDTFEDKVWSDTYLILATNGNWYDVGNPDYDNFFESYSAEDLQRYAEEDGATYEVIFAGS